MPAARIRRLTLTNFRSYHAAQVEVGATCVVLVHRPSGIAVKCQRERTQGANRLVARRMLADKIETIRLGRASARQQEAERVRRQKRRRSRRAKARMLRDQHAQSEKKASRGPVGHDD